MGRRRKEVGSDAARSQAEAHRGMERRARGFESFLDGRHERWLSIGACGQNGGKREQERGSHVGNLHGEGAPDGTLPSGCRNVHSPLGARSLGI
jgi:hypothetical protein